jgi:outer membrane lipoprotein SlyB
MNNQEISIKFSNKINGDKQLKDYEKKLQSIYSLLSGIEKSQNNVNKSKNEIKELSQETKNTGKNIEKLGNQFSTAFNLKSMSAVLKSSASFFKQLMNMSQKSVSYVENINLLEVAYQNMNEEIEESSKRIEDFVDKMAGVYGLDESDLSRKLGVFKQLANAMKLPTETAENLSELMVKMTNDIASLYNLDLNRASNALQSALAGQVRPIRTATGADITEKTLQNTVDKLGLDRSISQLSYVEKRLIMVISLTEQLKKSQGDYGRTIESASNQLRIFKEQWERLSRAIGNTFYPILEKVLPYLNAILMVLTEIFNLIAGLLGFKMPDFDYSGLSAMDDATLDLIDSMDEAGESADNLKSKMSGLRGFDKLNVITTPSSSGSTSVGGISGGIDPRIMDAFNSAFSKYDDMLDKVKLKANDIKESIMKWLGFVKKINPLTGDIEWSYQGLGKTIENIYNSFKKLSPLVKTVIGYITAKTLISTLKSILKLIGSSGIYKFLTLLLSPLKKMIEYIKVYKSITGNGLDGILGGIDSWKAHATNAERFSTALKGMTVNAIGLVSIKTSMDSINESGSNLLNTLGLVGGELSTVLGGAMIGASIGGGTGAIIGAVAGAIEGLITAIINYKSAGEKLIEQQELEVEESIKLKQAYIDRKNALEDEMDQTLAVSTHHQRLLEELQGLTDENGNLKKGYEDRAQFILTTLNNAYGTEYTLLDLQTGKTLELAEAIKKVIEQERNRIILEANEKYYKEAIENRTQAWYNYNKELEKSNELNTQGNTIREKMEEILGLVGTKQFENYEYTSLLNGEVYKGHYAYLQMKNDLATTEELLGKQNTKVSNARDVWQGYNEDIIFYEDLQTAVLTENVEEQNRLIDEHTSKVETSNGKEKLSLADQISYLRESKEETVRIYEENGKKITEGQKKNWENQEKNLAETLYNQSLNVETMTPEIAKAWGELGLTNESEFLDKFKKLPEDIQKYIVDEMNSKGYNISKELQDGIDKIKPTVNVEAKTSGVADALRKLSNVGSYANKVLSGEWSVSYAMSQAGLWAKGGLPPVGQLFIANEKGPELVGQIGGQSFVANQNQMMDLLDKKLGSAGQVMNPTFIIQVGDEKLASVVLENLQDMATSNGKPIVIGG